MEQETRGRTGKTIRVGEGKEQNVQNRQNRSRNRWRFGTCGSGNIVLLLYLVNYRLNPIFDNHAALGGVIFFQ